MLTFSNDELHLILGLIIDSEEKSELSPAEIDLYDKIDEYLDKS